MRKFLSILMLACLLCGLALPAGAEEACKITTGCTLADGHDGLCDALCTKTEGCTQYGGHEGECTLTCTKTKNCTKINGHVGLCDAMCDKTKDCTQYGGHEGECTLACAKTKNCTKANGHEGLCDALCTKTDGCTQYGGHEGACTLPCEKTKNCTKANGHEGLCDAMCDKTNGCLMYGGHAGDCLTELTLGSDENINSILASKGALLSRLPENLKTSTSITLRLPATTYADQIKVGNLDGINLTLKGATGQKTVMSGGIQINDSNVTLDGISFTGSPAIDLPNTVSQCAVSNCKFSGMPFQLHENTSGRAPMLFLTGNTYTSGNDFAVVLDTDGKTVVGTWQATPKADNAALQLGVGVYDYIPEKSSEVQAKEFFVDYSVDDAITDGWKFTFTFPCSFKEAYAVYNDGFGGKKGEGELTGTGDDKSYKMTVSGGGLYAAVSGSYPQLKDGKVVIRDVDKEYLSEVAVDTTYTYAVVKLGTKQIPSSINNKKLTFRLDGVGTYTVTATTTPSKTSAKTPTTARKYNYKYQDYYLITPQRVTDCMRYAKDNLVTIECKEAGRRSISLPVASMAAAAEKGYSILLKNEKIANITMDPAALKSMAQQAKGTTVLLHYRSLNHKTLTTVGLASVQSHLDQFPNDNADLAFLLTATSDSETIEDLQLGTITLKIPFIVLPGTEEMKNEVYALQTETSASARETTVTDGHLTTKLTDLTEHMVFQIGEPVETTEETTEPTVETTVETTQPETQPETVPETTFAPEPEEETEKGFPIWIPLVAVLLLGGGAAAWFLYFRKRFKK